MAFIKGISGNPQGRPKGATNKTGEDLRKLVSDFLENRFEGIINDFESLEAKDRLKFFLDLLQFGLPKLAATSNEINFESLTDEQLDEIINRLIKKQYAA